MPSLPRNVPFGMRQKGGEMFQSQTKSPDADRPACVAIRGVCVRECGDAAAAIGAMAAGGVWATREEHGSEEC